MTKITNYTHVEPIWSFFAEENRQRADIPVAICRICDASVVYTKNLKTNLKNSENLLKHFEKKHKQIYEQLVSRAFREDPSWKKNYMKPKNNKTNNGKRKSIEKRIDDKKQSANFRF